MEGTNTWKCSRCGCDLCIEDVFTITHADPKINMKPFCNDCADIVLAEHRAKLTEEEGGYSRPCEDYPCCGHEPGDCPDSEGRMRCVECGRRLSKNASSSLCAKCLDGIANRDEDALDHDYGMNY